MKRVCAWCGRQCGSDDDDTTRDFVTHGICVDCEEHFQANQPRSLRQFLNRFAVPILCVDGDVRVIAANDAAGDKLARDATESTDSMGGEFLECCWSRLPAGCGRTEHCVACTVRQLVSRTVEGDSDTYRQSAYVDRLDENGRVSRIDLVVSSERRGNLVLLELEETRESAQERSGPGSPP